MATVYVGKSHFNKASVYGLKMPNQGMFFNFRTCDFVVIHF